MPNEKQRRIIRNAARKHGIKPRILWGVYGQETNFGRIKSSSPAGAQGPFQFMPATARSYGINPHNFRQAANAAAKYLATYKSRGLAGMLAAYNAGPAGNPNNPETRAYIPGVKRHARSWPGAKGGGGGAGGRGGGGGRRASISYPKPQVANLAALLAQETSQPAPVSVTPPPEPAFSARRSLAMPQGFQQVPASSGPVAAPKTLAEQLRAIQQAGAEIRVQHPTVTPGSGGRGRGGARGGGGGGQLQARGAYSGTKRLARPAKRIATKMGVSSTDKRATKYTSSGNISDHWVGNKRAWAYDFDTPGIDVASGHKLARRIARRYGVNYKPDSYESGGTVKAGGKTYRIQILYGSGVDHGDHVHVGWELVG